MKRFLRASLIAAVYIVLCLLPGVSSLAFGPVQLRLAEGLTVLPILYVEAIPGLFLGAFVANLFGPLGLVDAVFGSLATLVAGLLTYRFCSTIYAYLAPVVVNGLVVSFYLHLFLELPYWPTALTVALGEAVVVFSLGRLLVNKLRHMNMD